VETLLALAKKRGILILAPPLGRPFEPALVTPFAPSWRDNGGWCPKGRRAEDGCIPAWYRLQETPGSSYPERTRKNVIDSDGTAVFTCGTLGGGSALTVEFAKEQGKPWLHIDLRSLLADRASASLREWAQKEGIAVLNVAGSRESNAPGIHDQVRIILVQAFGSNRS
jgi:hypothetical protein